MKVDKFGKMIARVAYHIFGIVLVISPFIDTFSRTYVFVDTLAFMGFFGLAHFTELGEK